MKIIFNCEVLGSQDGGWRLLSYGMWCQTMWQHKKNVIFILYLTCTII